MPNQLIKIENLKIVGPGLVAGAFSGAGAAVVVGKADITALGAGIAAGVMGTFAREIADTIFFSNVDYNTPDGKKKLDGQFTTGRIMSAAAYTAAMFATALALTGNNVQASSLIAAGGFIGHGVNLKLVYGYPQFFG